MAAVIRRVGGASKRRRRYMHIPHEMSSSRYYLQKRRGSQWQGSGKSRKAITYYAVSLLPSRGISEIYMNAPEAACIAGIFTSSRLYSRRFVRLSTLTEREEEKIKLESHQLIPEHFIVASHRLTSSWSQKLNSEILVDRKHNQQHRGFQE